MIRQSTAELGERGSPPARKSVQMSQSKHMLQMFQSEDFTNDQVIQYFIATFDEPGPHQFLTHKLLSMSERFVEYYIPQFWYYYMQVKNYSYSMESFLEELCKRSISNYMKIMWCMHAYAEGERESPRFQKIERRLEAAMVNGAFQIKKLEVLANQDSVEFNIRLQKLFQEKEHRFNYVSLVARFIIRMVRISLSLKQLPLDQRKASLALQIKQGNKAIRNQRKTHKDLKYYWGILLPFQRSNDFDEASNLVHLIPTCKVVRIIQSDYACFNTKTRVPYRILVETISQQEIELKSQQLEEQTNDAKTLSDSDSFFNFDTQSLESHMRDLTKAKLEDEVFEKLAAFQQEEVQLQAHVPRRQQQSRDMYSFRCHLRIVDLTAETDHEQPRKKSHEARFLRQFPRRPQLLHTIEQHFDKVEQPDWKMEQNTISKICKGTGPWGEDWDAKLQRIKDNSPFKDFESYRCRPIIVKGGDDLRQELLAMQVIQKIDEVFRKAYLNLYLKPYEIIITSENSGLIEFVPNTLAMDGLKKSFLPRKRTLKEFYFQHFQEDVFQAQRNFVESLAAYSLICYLLQVKDRHNGNILVDNQGHIIHIDFGFMLSNSPGNMNFENAPFKFTQEYLELMNGQQSQLYEYFQILMIRGFLEIRKHTQAIVQLIETMMEKSNFPCFKNFNLEVFRGRFKEGQDGKQCETYVLELIEQSRDNWRTIQYDNFQRLTNGIEP